MYRRVDGVCLVLLSSNAKPNNRSNSRLWSKPETVRQYARLAEAWIREIGLDPPAYGTLSLLRTKNLRAIQILLGHTKLESTIRYLGVQVEDALEIAEQTDI